MDTCTLIIAMTMSSLPCQMEKSCGMTVDGSKQICTEYCRPLPQSYDCQRPDGTKYIWTPQPGESSVLLKPANGNGD